MRVLTIRQPWSEAIIFGGKDVENRTTNVAGAYRGTVAIHTAKYQPTPAEWNAFGDAHPDAMSQMAHTVPWGQEEVGDVFHLVLANPRPPRWKVACINWSIPDAPHAITYLLIGGEAGLERFHESWADAIAWLDRWRDHLGEWAEEIAQRKRDLSEREVTP